MYIDGNWATADGVLEVTNPANGEVIGSVPDGGREDAARAIDAAAKAFPSWSGLTAYQRSDYLYRAHKIMMERREDLARMMQPWLDVAPRGSSLRELTRATHLFSSDQPLVKHRVGHLDEAGDVGNLRILRIDDHRLCRERERTRRNPDHRAMPRLRKRMYHERNHRRP